MTLSGKAAIAGIGATEFSKESGRSELQLSVEAVRAALAEHGPAARVTACELRLGAPAYPDDTLAFEGHVSEERDTEQGKEIVVDVVGKVSLGAHATSRVTLVVPR
jgi:hypothetical protein